MSLNPTADFHRLIDLVDRKLDEALSRLEYIERKVRIVPTREQLNQAKADLRQAIEDETTQVTTKIQELIDQLNAGNPVTEEDLQDILDDTNRVKGILPDQTP